MTAVHATEMVPATVLVIVGMVVIVRVAVLVGMVGIVVVGMVVMFVVVMVLGTRVLRTGSMAVGVGGVPGRADLDLDTRQLGRRMEHESADLAADVEHDRTLPGVAVVLDPRAVPVVGVGVGVGVGVDHPDGVRGPPGGRRRDRRPPRGSEVTARRVATRNTPPARLGAHGAAAVAATVPGAHRARPVAPAVPAPSGANIGLATHRGRRDGQSAVFYRRHLPRTVRLAMTQRCGRSSGYFRFDHHVAERLVDEAGWHAEHLRLDTPGRTTANTG